MVMEAVGLRVQQENAELEKQQEEADTRKKWKESVDHLKGVV